MPECCTKTNRSLPVIPAVLLLIALSQMCLIGVACAAEPAATPAVSRSFGGPGGVPFVDEVHSTDRLTRLRLTTSRVVCSLRVAMSQRVLPQHGSRCREQTTLSFAADEYLVGIEGRYGRFVAEISFISNLRTYGPYGGGFDVGGKQARKRFSLQASAGNEVVGFAGRAGSRLDAIGIVERRRGGALAVAPLSALPRPVNVAIRYAPIVSGGVNPAYSWSFGDGTPPTNPRSNARIAHTFTAPGRYGVILTATDATGAVVTRRFIQAIHFPVTGTLPRSSQSMAVEPGSGRVWNVNEDNDSVSVTDPVSAAHTEIAVGSAPRCLAFAPDGRLWVSNERSAAISIISPVSLSVVQTVALPRASEPFGLLFDPQGRHAYVALQGSGLLLQLDPADGTETGRLAVEAGPRHLAVNAEGTQLFVSRFITPPLPGEATAAPRTLADDGSPLGGEVRVVATAPALSLVRTIVLHHADVQDTPASARGIPNYLGPVIVAPDGRSAWVPSKQDNIKRGQRRDGIGLSFESTVRGISSRINLAALSENPAQRIDHDNTGIASTAVFHPSSNYLFTALEATREVAVVDAYNRQELLRLPVGRAPHGLALSADARTLYVHNFMDRTISSFDLSQFLRGSSTQIPLLATYTTVTTETLSPEVLRGKQLFYDARDRRLARDGYLSCAVCHNDGGHDGRVWDLSNFGEGLRNTISLRGHAGMGEGRLHWTANFDEVQDFEAQIRNLAGGTGLMDNALFVNEPLGPPKAGLSADLDALAAYVNSLGTFPASPNRQADGTLTAAAVAGRSLFSGKNCASCHSGTVLTDSSLAADVRHDIGSIKATSGNRLGGPLTALDTPTLRGLWATAPYLHDGSAATIAAAIAAHTLPGLTLNPTEISDLAQFLGQLEDTDP